MLLRTYLLETFICYNFIRIHFDVNVILETKLYNCIQYTILYIYYIKLILYTTIYIDNYH